MKDKEFKDITLAELLQLKNKDSEKIEKLKKLLDVENFDDVGITLDKVQVIVFDLDDK